MEEMENRLRAREQYLVKLIKQKEKALAKAPEGLLRISNSGNHTQYYHRTDPKNFNGTYIKEKNFSFVQKLAQKDYDKKILQSAEKELKAIRSFFDKYPRLNPEEIYGSLHTERQKLIIPIKEDDQHFIKNWESVEYESKGFYSSIPELYTSKGERVRSKSEVIIADLLYKEGIPYRYEYPLYLKEFETVYPDFMVLNVRLRKELYWEHFGMMDDVEYVEKAIHKIRTYEQNGLFVGDNLIITFESKQNPLNQKSARRLIEKYLK